MQKLSISSVGKSKSRSGTTSFIVELEVSDDFSLAGSTNDIKTSLKHLVNSQRADIYSKHRIDDFEIKSWNSKKINDRPKKTHTKKVENAEPIDIGAVISKLFKKPYYFIPLRIVWSIIKGVFLLAFSILKIAFKNP